MSAAPINDGGPAFPTPGEDFVDGPHGKQPAGAYGMQGAQGISTRDYFAAKALQGFCANPAVFADNPRTGWALVNSNEADLLGYCFTLADEALKARAS